MATADFAGGVRRRPGRAPRQAGPGGGRKRHIVDSPWRCGHHACPGRCRAVSKRAERRAHEAEETHDLYIHDASRSRDRGAPDAGLYKAERVITSKQAGEIAVESAGHVLNFCANNYLGLADDAEIGEAAKAALDRYGFGMASVRFICGTQGGTQGPGAADRRLSGHGGRHPLRGMLRRQRRAVRDASGREDAVISDALNHASIIDGVRLSKAAGGCRYAEQRHGRPGKMRCSEASDARFRLIATDGVFSMDGIIANLQGICDLAEKYDAMVMVDDCHATGFLGAHGRGSPEYCGVEGRVDILTGTLGKAMGGASGGYTAARGTDHRVAAPALATLSVLEHAGPGDRGGLAEGAGPGRGRRRPARAPVRQCPALP